MSWAARCNLTNILRDIDEDAAIGRCYLPGEALDAAGITARDPHEIAADPRVDGAARWLARLTRSHFKTANDLLARRPKGLLLAPRLMAQAYGGVLDRMEATGWSLPRAQVRVSKPALALAALRLILLH